MYYSEREENVLLFTLFDLDRVSIGNLIGLYTPILHNNPPSIFIYAIVSNISNLTLAQDCHRAEEYKYKIKLMPH